MLWIIIYAIYIWVDFEIKLYKLFKRWCKSKQTSITILTIKIFNMWHFIFSKKWDFYFITYLNIMNNRLVSFMRARGQNRNWMIHQNDLSVKPEPQKKLQRKQTVGWQNKSWWRNTKIEWLTNFINATMVNKFTRVHSIEIIFTKDL